MKRVKVLESLRGIFCIMIVWGIHYDWFFTGGYNMSFPFETILFPIKKYGYLGVEFFFILSGYGIATGYKNKLLNSHITFKDYLLKRIKKLYPIMIFSIILTFIGIIIYRMLTGYNYYVENFSFLSLLLSIFGISSGWFYNDVNINMPLWYVSVLMLLYIIYYFITRCSKKNNFKYISLCTLFFIIGWSLLCKPINVPFAYENVARGYMCFFGGCLLKEINDKLNNNLKRKISIISIIINLLLFLLVLKFGIKATLGDLRIVLIIFTYPTLIISVQSLKILQKILLVKPFEFLGKISTDLYFWHFPAFLIIRIIAIYFPIQKFYSLGWFYLLMIIYSILIAIVSNKFFKSKYYKIKTKKII